MQKPYRPNVGLMIINDEKLVLVAHPAKIKTDNYQMPQGGIDDGETPEQAAYRELYEETGITGNNVRLLAQSQWYSYDFPKEIQEKITEKYAGQRQKWFLFLYMGKDLNEALSARADKELDGFMWAQPETLPRTVVAFKSAVYEKVLAEFRPYLKK